MGRYFLTVLPAWIAGSALSYMAMRMGLSEQYLIAFAATAILTSVLALNPGLQLLKVGSLAPLAIVLGFYSRWIPTTAEGILSPREAAFLLGLEVAAASAAAGFLLGTIRRAPRLALWVAVLSAATFLLAEFSGSAGGARGMIEWMMATFHLDRATAFRATVALRKTIHVTFYGTVAWSAFWSGWHGRLAGARAALYAAAIALTMACFDETRQQSSPGRGASGWDVALDMSGAPAAVIFCVTGARGRKRNEEDRVSPLVETSP